MIPTFNSKQILIMIFFYLVLNILSGCVTKTIIIEKTKYIDIETYKTWGTTRLVPIGVRPLPTEEEICKKPFMGEILSEDI